MQQGNLPYKGNFFAPCLDLGQLVAVRPEDMVVDVFASVGVRQVGAFSQERSQQVERISGRCGHNIIIVLKSLISIKQMARRCLVFKMLLPFCSR